MISTDLARRDQPRIAVIIPCYRVKKHIEAVVGAIGPWADSIYCVDDACPDSSGKFIEETLGSDARINVVYREHNGGVGAATMTGYAAAIADGADVLIKIDGDNQMDPSHGPAMARPIVDGQADYVKGNRFFSGETVARMPFVRLIGNAGLSFLTKLSTGYWDLFDPTNGYTAIHAAVAREIPFAKTHKRYFFESDMLFRLSILRARIVELPGVAIYGDEESNLNVLQTLITFPLLHARNLFKRIAYNYFLRNFSVASLMLVSGILLMLGGATFGTVQWATSHEAGLTASAGTVMLAALPALAGFQLFLNFWAYDINSTPSEPVHPRIALVRALGSERAD